MLESQSRAFKTLIILWTPKKTWTNNFAHWIGAQDWVKLTKKSRKHAPVMTSPTENPKPKTKKRFFFNFN